MIVFLFFFFLIFFFLSERLPSGNDVVNNLHIDRNLIMSAKENVAAVLDDERRSIPPRRLPPIPEDKLHRVSSFFFFLQIFK
jgi:hypothetical protein